MMNEARNEIIKGSFASWKKIMTEQFKQRL
jgi:hypothetical protein